MSDNLAERVAVIDAVTLLPLIERALGVPVRGVSNWQFTPIGGGYAARVWRFKGQADLQTGPTAWSMVLKVPGEEVGVGDPWGGVRESVVYQSDFRSPVPDTFTLPNCYGAVEQPVGRSWIWLEDVIHDSSPTWTASRYTDVVS